MRIWSLHPQLLDTKGLVALWRETLLAKHVLLGKTKGYKNHPQLNRFKKQSNPVNAINCYLNVIQKHAETIGYNFDKDKVGEFEPCKIVVTNGQVEFELNHLKKKLQTRDLKKFDMIKDMNVEIHPMFEMVNGNIEDWEKV